MARRGGKNDGGHLAGSIPQNREGGPRPWAGRAPRRGRENRSRRWSRRSVAVQLRESRDPRAGHRPAREIELRARSPRTPPPRTVKPNVGKFQSRRAPESRTWVAQSTASCWRSCDAREIEDVGMMFVSRAPRWDRRVRPWGAQNDRAEMSRQRGNSANVFHFHRPAPRKTRGARRRDRRAPRTCPRS